MSGIKEIESVAYINVGRAVTLQELDTWKVKTGQTIHFKLHASSSFAPLAEGVAIGLLQSWREQYCHFMFSCTYTVDRTGEESYGIFDSVFGMALLVSALSGQDKSGIKINAFRDDFWTKLQKNSGGLGDKWMRSMLCRDPDYPIPGWIKRQSGTGLPDSADFRIGLTQMVEYFKIKTNEDYSVSEKDALQFLYQTFLNSCQHAITARYPNNYIKNRNGVRGLILDKIIYIPNDADNAKVVSEYPLPLQDYIQRTWKFAQQQERLFLSYTVADIGQGIHRTLPDRLNDPAAESKLERLNRAFMPGQTCLPPGTVLDRGQGLAKVAAACERLKAFLFVRSADLLAYRDFTLPTASADLLSLWPDALDVGNEGTSLTLIWPKSASGGDQLAFNEQI